MKTKGPLGSAWYDDARCDDGTLHIMWSCNPGIWPTLAGANKYSEACNCEARRVEHAPFPALWRAISKSYSQFLLGAACRERKHVHLADVIVRGAASRELNPDAESRTIGRGEHDVAYLVRSHLACNNEIAASERASKRDEMEHTHIYSELREK